MTPRDDPGPIRRLVYTRYTPKFERVDYTTLLNGPFDMNVPLQAALQEAEAKDCMVVIQLALVPVVDFYGEQPSSESTEEQHE